MPLRRRTRELLRKGVHLFSLILLPISFYHAALVPWLLLLVCVVYWGVETLRQNGYPIPGLSSFIRTCKRPGEEARMDPGPYYLAGGVGFAFLFLSLPAAQIGLIHISLGDAAASLAGHFLPAHQKLPYSKHKSWVGTLAFTLLAFAGTLFFLPWPQALIIALIGAGIESVPVKDIDNLTVPLGVALIVTLLGWG